MPKSVLNCNLVASHGKYSFDPTTKVLQWFVGKIELGRPPTLKGSVSLHAILIKLKGFRYL
jgi:AP-3 complex subunit mu